MSGRGVLFAIDDSDLARLGDAETDQEVRDIALELEARWDEAHLCELEKAWDPIHRILTNGQLDYQSGRPPLNWAILGGTRLFDGLDAIVTAKAADQVEAVAEALRAWNRDRVKQAYYRIPRNEYGDLDERDLEYVWAYFSQMIEFWQGAAGEERAVLFAVNAL